MNDAVTDHELQRVLTSVLEKLTKMMTTTGAIKAHTNLVSAFNQHLIYIIQKYEILALMYMVFD